MRIGIPLSSLSLRWGGIRVYTVEIVKHLLQIDARNDYVLIYPGSGAARHTAAAPAQACCNVREAVVGPRGLRSNFVWDQALLPRAARRHDLDVLFNPFLSVPIAGRFKKVMVMHAVEYHTVPSVYDWKMYTRWWFLEKAIVPAADRLISISQLMTKDIARLVDYPIENVRTVYHGVDEKFRVIEDSAALATVKARYSLPDDYILFVGHIYPQKNFANLVRALHLIADDVASPLVVVGRPRWKYEDILRVVKDLGLEDRVLFLDEVPNDDLPALYNLAACFVFPSLYEAFGLVQIEAMACGCPVVASNTGAIPEISGGAALLFDPNEPEDIADKLRRMLQDSELRRSYVEKGLARAQYFTWERCARETLHVLEECAAR